MNHNMNHVTTLRELEQAAIDYRQTAAKRIKLNQVQRRTLVKQNEIDGVLADFINYFGETHGIRYGLHRTHLKGGKVSASK